MTTESSKYERITTNQQDTKSNPNPNTITKQHEVVSTQLNIVTCPTYPEKFIRNCYCTVLLLVTLPLQSSRFMQVLQNEIRTCWCVQKLADLPDRPLGRNAVDNNNCSQAGVLYCQFPGVNYRCYAGAAASANEQTPKLNKQTMLWMQQKVSSILQLLLLSL